MSNQESDPCKGCRHLRTYSCPCQRPTCARKAQFGNDRCRKEPVGWVERSETQRGSTPKPQDRRRG